MTNKSILTRALAKIRQRYQVGYEFRHYLDDINNYPEGVDGKDDTSPPLVPNRYPEEHYHTKKYNRKNLKKTLFHGEEEARIFPREHSEVGEAPYHFPHPRWSIDPHMFKKLVDHYDEHKYMKMGIANTNKNGHGLYKEYVQAYEIYGLPKHEYHLEGRNFFGDEYFHTDIPHEHLFDVLKPEYAQKLRDHKKKFAYKPSEETTEETTEPSPETKN